MKPSQKPHSINTRIKWRPSLAMVIFAVLATVMAMPLIGLGFFRLYENQLVQQTETELIAQGAVLTALYAEEVKHELKVLEGIDNRFLKSDVPLGVARPSELRPDPKEPYHPQVPMLDVSSDAVLQRRPAARLAAGPVHPVYKKIGRKLFTITRQTQKVTLAGFRILDPQGNVIGGKTENGFTLAHIPEVQRALRGSYAAVLRERISDEPPPPLYSISRGTKIRIFVAMPVIVNERVAGVIYLSRTPNNIVKHLYGEGRKVLTAALTLLAVTLFIGFVFWRGIVGPIYALIKRTSEIGSGNRNAIMPLERHGTQEIAQLSQSFLNMAQNLVDRAEYISTFAAHVSHELKSPLTSIQGAAELIRDASDSMSNEEREKFLGNIITDTERLTALLSRLRELARADNPETGGTTTALQIRDDLQAAYGSIVNVEPAPDTRLNISQENILIIFSHLIDNALQHKAQTITISIKTDGVTATLGVQDDGSGISPQNREKIFETFFTTRRETGGTGMGLGIVQAMLEAHEGSIRLLQSQNGAGFQVRIPLAQPEG